MAKQKFYVVWKGKLPGIYSSWEACKKQIDGYQDAVYKSFKDRTLAEKAFNEGSENYIGLDERILNFSDEKRQLIGSPMPNSISVDAACSGNPGVLEYRGVHTSSGREIFRKGPFPEGTVNLGEFLALVHGIAYLKQKMSKKPVYSDSRTAISWVKKKRVNTKLERNIKNDELFQLVDRALKWLHNNSFDNQILKWETKYWGEIPADFGRK
ncbi:MAG: ribonuclease H family protein [Bacteroidales bacterium]|nr:ribonuclease H family protein [Bacteroidales bacterium]